MKPVNPEWNSYKLLAWVLSLGVDEADLLKHLVAELPPDPIVINIGAAAGASTMAMLEERPDDIFIFSIDTNPDCGEMIELDKAGLADLHRVVRILGKSGEAGTHFPLAVDAVFVDGDHRADGVAADIEAWLPKVKPGGWIAFHDYHSTLFVDVKAIVDGKMDGAEVVADVETIRVFRVSA